MGRTQTYSDEQLTDAVVQYARICKTKIKVSELVKWSQENIPELKYVKEYHFSRPVVTRDKNGGRVETEKECTKLINKLNSERSTVSQAKLNVILYSTDPDAFFSLDHEQQIRSILDCRKLVKDLMTRSDVVEKSRRSYRLENETLKQKNAELESQNKQLKEEFKKMKAACDEAGVKNDNEKMAAAFAEIGVSEDDFKITEFAKKLTTEPDPPFDMRTVAESQPQLPPEKPQSIVSEIISGIDFGNTGDNDNDK